MPYIRPLLIAMQFLTRMPLPRQATPEPVEIGGSVVYYPLVGAIIGAALALLAAVMAARVPALVAAAIVLVLWVAVTGGLHLDGLADSADAWACGGDADRRLEVMKDPRCGPAATSAITLTLIVKFAALAALIQGGHWAALVLAPTLGRTAPVAAFLTMPYVRQGGLGVAMARYIPVAPGWAVIGAVTLAAALAGQAAMWAATVVAFIALRQMMIRYIGGATGDTIGATVELVEAAALVVAALAGGRV